MDVFKQQGDPALRRTRFAELFHQDFDGPGIARFVVGRYWRTASPEEQQDFIKIFEDYVAVVYTARLGDFGGEHINIRGSRSDGEGVIVSTAIFGPRNTSPVNVDWRLVTDNGAYKINDIIVEGISMGVTQRSEFACPAQWWAVRWSDRFDETEDRQRSIEPQLVKISSALTFRRDRSKLRSGIRPAQ